MTPVDHSSWAWDPKILSHEKPRRKSVGHFKSDQPSGWFFNPKNIMGCKYHRFQLVLRKSHDFATIFPSVPIKPPLIKSHHAALIHLLGVFPATRKRPLINAARPPKNGVLPSYPIMVLLFTIFYHMGMGQYLLIPFFMGWTSINPSYFDVNYRGTRFWHTAIFFKSAIWRLLADPTEKWWRSIALHS